MPVAVEDYESEYDKKMTDSEAWEPNDSALGGFTERVCIFSGSPMLYVTESTAGITSGEQEASSS